MDHAAFTYWSNFIYATDEDKAAVRKKSAASNIQSVKEKNDDRRSNQAVVFSEGNRFRDGPVNPAWWVRVLNGAHSHISWRVYMMSVNKLVSHGNLELWLHHLDWSLEFRFQRGVL